MGVLVQEGAGFGAEGEVGDDDGAAFREEEAGELEVYACCYMRKGLQVRWGFITFGERGR